MGEVRVSCPLSNRIKLTLLKVVAKRSGIAVFALVRANEWEWVDWLFGKFIVEIATNGYKNVKNHGSDKINCTDHRELNRFRTKCEIAYIPIGPSRR